MTPKSSTDPSLSPLPSITSKPDLLHTFRHQDSSVLSLAQNEDYIFSGGQDSDILVWDKQTLTLQKHLHGHTGSVLALEIAKDRDWLFSCSGDSTVMIWSTKDLKPLCVLHPYGETAAGDLFSLVWSTTCKTIFVGCQNTCLQWYQFGQTLDLQSEPGSPVVTTKAHKFFDSYPRGERRPADLSAHNNSRSSTVDWENLRRLDIPETHTVDYAHYGYLYCMAIVSPTKLGQTDGYFKDRRGVCLVTGSGDETVKYWRYSARKPVLLHTFECSQGAVLSLVSRDELVYAGCQDGFVKVWDIGTKTLVRTIIVQEGVAILSMTLINSNLHTCTAKGEVQRWSETFTSTASWRAHAGHIVLSSIRCKATDSDEYRLLTGGSDSCIKLWSMNLPHTKGTVSELPHGQNTNDTLIYTISKFVSIASVCPGRAHERDCLDAAGFLKGCLSQLGAHSTLIPNADGNHPLVLATFSGTQSETKKPRVLFYGHYDVVDAQPAGWNSDPFTLTGLDGYLYGRGVTDDKGPILAAAFAAAELLQKRALGIDLVFVIEGEEGIGSPGLKNAIKAHKNLIGHIDAILVSNATWVTDDIPCITYGLRGVIRCAVEIASGIADMHSGTGGGGTREPMVDMVKLLATLTDDQGRALIPSFYDGVRPEGEQEKQLYERLSHRTHLPALQLSSRWREPSLTVHEIEISGPKSATVISGTIRAMVSIRVVPDQDIDKIAASICECLESSFKRFHSPNQLKVTSERVADWWLGNLDNPWFRSLEKAVQDEWGVEPLLVREGGSVPSVPYLENEFGCPAVHLPLGQSSANIHLPNERISLANLVRGKHVLERFFVDVAKSGISSTDQ